jgi:dienelactone hydrolase
MTPRIEVVPQHAVSDELVSLRLIGFPIGHLVTLRARMASYLGSTWESHATFLTDTEGSVDVSTRQPFSGTYTQVDPMGLFWSMVPSVDAELADALPASATPLRVQFEAEVNNVVLASAEAERQFAVESLTRTEVRDNGMVAVLYRPARESGLHPAVIVVSGSGGGLWEGHAALLASRGFVTLALAYFAIEPLPSRLAEIPLEYFRSAIHWLRRQDGVDPEALAVLGGSRGGELALLLGATFPEIRAVVAYVPSGVLWEGMGQPGGRPPSWTLDGQAAPFMRRRDDVIEWSHPPIALTPGFMAALQDDEAVAQATIPVERTRGPILLISGGDDQMWPSARMAEIAVRRLQRRGFDFPVEHLSYQGAGHLVVTPPYLPSTLNHARHPFAKLDFAFGGSPADEAFARADSWPRVVAFLGGR